jgi:hypothetical protein
MENTQGLFGTDQLIGRENIAILQAQIFFLVEKAFPLYRKDAILLHVCV